MRGHIFGNRELENALATSEGRGSQVTPNLSLNLLLLYLCLFTYFTSLELFTFVCCSTSFCCSAFVFIALEFLSARLFSCGLSREISRPPGLSRHPMKAAVVLPRGVPFNTWCVLLFHGCKGTTRAERSFLGFLADMGLIETEDSTSRTLAIDVGWHYKFF